MCRLPQGSPSVNGQPQKSQRQTTVSRRLSAAALFRRAKRLDRLAARYNELARLAILEAIAARVWPHGTA